MPFGAGSAYLDLLCWGRCCGDSWAEEGGCGGGDGGGGGGDGGGGGGDSLGVSVVCGGCVGGGGDLRAGRAGGAGVSDYDRSCDEERGGCGGSGCGGLGDGVHYSGGDSGRDGGTVQRSS